VVAMRRLIVISMLLALGMLQACSTPLDLVPLQVPGAAVPIGQATPAITPDQRSTVPVPLFAPDPQETPHPGLSWRSVGQSWEGRDIWVWQVGTGLRSIALVGAMHGGYEGNTAVLGEQLLLYFRQHADHILPNITLHIIPVANPDGLARGSTLEGRFNGRGVDLNRNWGCEWSEEAFLQSQPVDPGARPFSEPETLALQAYLLEIRPAVTLFYHSKANGIFPGACGDLKAPAWPGDALTRATGYPVGEFDHYPVSGDASNWLVSAGLPSFVVELETSNDPEFERNLAGVMALQCTLAEQDIAGSGADDMLHDAYARLCR